jgi:hypothetical protein
MTMRARTAAVIGGGIVGLAVARELVRRFPGIEVTVFDKEARVAAHQRACCETSVLSVFGLVSFPGGAATVRGMTVLPWLRVFSGVPRAGPCQRPGPLPAAGVMPG